MSMNSEELHELAEAISVLEDFTYAFEVCMQGAERTRPLPDLDGTILRARAAITQHRCRYDHG